MFHKILCLFVTLFIFVVSVQGDAASFVVKCKHDDSKCIKDNIATGIPLLAKGNPEIGMNPVDPLFLKKVDASTPSLKFIVTDATITGLGDCVTKKASRPEKNKLLLKIECEGKLNGQYEMNGRLLVLPIQGKGAVYALLRKLVIDVDLDLNEKTGKDGKAHWDIKKFKHSFELKDKADVVFENLFNGNEVLGRAARDLISTNSNDIVLELGPPVIKALITEVVRSVNKFFNAVPMEDLTLDF